MVADNPEAAADIVKKMMGGAKPALAAAAAPVPGGSGLSLEQKKKLLWGGKKKETTEGAPAAVFGHNRWDQAELGNDSDKLKFLKLMGGRTAAETLQQAGGSLPPPEPEDEEYEPVFGPAAPWELEQQQQQAEQQQAAVGAAAGVPSADRGMAEMEVEAEAATEAAAPAVVGPAGPPVMGPAFEGVAPTGPANIMKREGQQRVLSELEREFNSGLARRNRTTGLGA
ncbi:U1 small nuclear ribonucleo 70 kDa-like isoform X2 isoform B [Chlorella sorokiniana]|uniref:U1 small nuclear ribonucleo 70 kDa-like isoform X2 isoform B n=1 Tax=Chlorella sorokiniana TaxID=3076 RepID=A0A2P6TUC3_CHLSO|nr:U1 small nuclear ribonucleo 70 kDa-like isoform X2 isoform B [Chlorella sorokiniana]|eukprot:PRW57661.1 U1 small nuclear ribonucleo 70 kDa-like isoform X2 isoform B [Chlorella sorokiniana]